MVDWNVRGTVEEAVFLGIVGPADAGDGVAVQVVVGRDEDDANEDDDEGILVVKREQEVIDAVGVPLENLLHLVRKPFHYAERHSCSSTGRRTKTFESRLSTRPREQDWEA
jgi:hypothetical protein